MMKVASNKFLMKLEDQLPTSYQTLYEMTKLVDEVGEDRFLELLDLELLSNESSRHKLLNVVEGEDFDVIFRRRRRNHV